MRTPTRLICTCIALSLYLYGSGYTQSSVQEERVTIKTLIGKAEVRSSETGKWRQARVGMLVKMKWDIRTFMESSVELLFASGTIITLGENSVVSLTTILQDQSTKKTSSNVKVGSGKVWANVQKLVNKQSDFSFETPTAVAAIRGTRLGISIVRDQSIIDVYEGKVGVRKIGARQEIVVATKNRAVVQKDKSDIELIKFEDIKAKAGDTTSLLPPVDPYESDTSAADSTVPVDTTNSNDSTQIDSTQIDSTQIDSTQIDSTQIDSAEIDSAEIDSAEIDSAEIDSAEVDSAEVDSLITDTSALYTPDAQTLIDTNITEYGDSILIDTSSGDTTYYNYSDTSEALTSATDTQNTLFDASAVETTDTIDTEELDTSTILSATESANIDTTSQTQTPQEVSLSIESPDNNSDVTQSEITVTGTTLPGAIVSVGAKQTVAQNNGRFSLSVSLLPGTNTISVTATYGSSSKTENVSVTYTAPKVNFLSLQQPSEGQMINKPTVTVTGATVPGAAVTVNGNAATVGADGNFSALVTLPNKPGDHVITIISSFSGNEMQQTRTVTFSPQLFLTVSQPADGQSISSPLVSVAGATVPGATVTINGITVTAGTDGNFHASITLPNKPGDHIVTVTSASDGNEIQQTRTVTLVPQLFLSVRQPAEGQTLNRPVIAVAGMTVPGARVTVNGNTVTAGLDGSFSYQIYIPDESGEYIVTIISSYGSNEMQEERTVKYVPLKPPLFLDITSPVNNKTITTPVLSIAGRTTAQAVVTVNGRRIPASNGIIAYQITVTERDIGEYALTITASDEQEEISKNISVTIDIHSPMININPPRLDAVGITQGATPNGTFLIRTIDMTPEDLITVSASVNGSSEKITLGSNSQEKIFLNEGKNVYSIKAADLAGNNSNIIAGELYYLPGPLSIDINKPESNPLIISDLPPMPGKTIKLSIDFEIIIDDGIGSVPETILFCRVKSVSSEILLKKTSDYTYSGSIEVFRGTNNFTIETQDMAGNIARKQVTIIINP